MNQHNIRTCNKKHSIHARTHTHTHTHIYAAQAHTAKHIKYTHVIAKVT